MSDTPEEKRPAWPKRAYRWAASRTAAALIVLSLGVVVALIIMAGTQGYLLDWELLLEYLKVLLGWPLIVLAIAIVLRKSLTELVGNIIEVAFPGGHIKMQQRQANQVEGAVVVATETDAEDVREIKEKAHEQNPELRLPELSQSTDRYAEAIWTLDHQPSIAVWRAMQVLKRRINEVVQPPPELHAASLSTDPKAQLKVVRYGCNQGWLSLAWADAHLQLVRGAMSVDEKTPINVARTYVDSARELDRGLDAAEVRRWAIEHKVTPATAERVLRTQRNATEANDQPQ